MATQQRKNENQLRFYREQMAYVVARNEHVSRELDETKAKVSALTFELQRERERREVRGAVFFFKLLLLLLLENSCM